MPGKMQKRFKPLPIPFRYILLAAFLLVGIFVFQSYVSYTMRQNDRFLVSEETLWNLKSESVPDSIIGKVEKLGNEVIMGEEHFFNRLKEHLGQADTEMYRGQIFKYTFQRPEPFNWMEMFSFSASNYVFWAFLTPLVYNILQAYPLDRQTGLGKKFIHFLLAILVAAFHELASTVIYFLPPYLSGRMTIDARLLSHVIPNYPAGVVGRFVEYIIIIGGFIAIDYYRKFRDKQLELITVEKELSNAQLNALKMQLHPHFLFNTLHTISSLMERNIEGAQKVVSQLGHLLRSILEQDKKHSIPLSEELKYIRSYLDIEQVRFNDRLQIKYDISKDTLDALVPNLILQPLVENAVKHGFSKRTDCGVIKVTSRRLNGSLEIIIEDDGRGVSDPAVILSKPGIGIQNVKDRLKQMYADDFEFEITSPNQQGFIVRMDIPFVKAGD